MRVVLTLILTLLAARAHAAELIVLGIAQDAGVPQFGCVKSCCSRGVEIPPACVALVDGEQRWLFDATPAIGVQLRTLDRLAPVTRDSRDPGLDGIFLTHAHIGHYTGLTHLGREVMGSSELPVYAMERMARFLRENGPWSQLVNLGNISIRRLEHDLAIEVGDGLFVTPMLVPHRDEYSETVGFFIEGPSRRALYLPDINKWQSFDRPLKELVLSVDVALLDATFFDIDELPGRDMSEIPHPFIVESMQLLDGLSAEDRARVHFIHLNHSNPALDPRSTARRRIVEAGFAVAEVGERFEL